MTPLTGDMVLFEAGGRPPCDSALELALQVAERAPNLRLMWVGPRSKSHLLEIPQFVYARRRSMAHIVGLARSRLIITTHGSRRLPATKTPILQNFHAIPIKKLGHRNLRVDAIEIRPIGWDFVLSPSRFFEREVIEAFSWSGVRIHVPLPRYSLTLRVQREDTRLRLRRALGLDPSTKIVLFAPTYRAAHDLGSFDPMSSRRFLAYLLRDEYFVLGRSHYLDRFPKLEPEEEQIRELNAEDSLLVLSACDVLVTDYSSLMVDAAFLDIPTVLLVPDLDTYEKSPGLTIPLRQLANGKLSSSIASTAEQVMEQAPNGFAPEWRDMLLTIAGLPHDPLSHLRSPFEEDRNLAKILTSQT